MGDNRSMSKDSRKTEIGLISIKDVVGKAVYRVWPLQSFGKIE
jgi:signal peptidase I